MEVKDLDTLVLESRYGQLQYCIKGPIETSWRDGFPQQAPKHIVLHFDRYLCEVADEARDQEWTDEDKLYVCRALEASFKNPMFTDMWEHKRVLPSKPWPLYDETDPKQIPMIAQATGMLSEALQYETQTRPDGPREAVVKKLEDLISVSETEPQVSSDDFAAV